MDAPTLIKALQEGRVELREEWWSDYDKGTYIKLFVREEKDRGLR